MSEFVCDCCHEHVDGLKNPTTLVADNGTPYEGYTCDTCRLAGRTTICLGCWHRVLLSDAVPHPNGVNYLCRWCAQRMPKNDHVLGYEEEHNVELDPHGRGNKFVGFELEYICHECLVDEQESEYDCANCYIAHDIFNRLKAYGLLNYAKSTLDSTAAGEIVTAPMSIKFLESLRGKEVLKEITSVIRDCGGYENPSVHSPCQSIGGHIHVSRTYVNKNKQEIMPDVLARLVYATRTFWHRISGRDSLSNYATFTCRHEHTSAINDTSRTFEFRFWGSSLDPWVLRARAVICTTLLEFLNHIHKPHLIQLLQLDPSDGQFRELIYESLLRPYIEWLHLLPQAKNSIRYIRDMYLAMPPRGFYPDKYDNAFSDFINKEIVQCQRQ